MSRAMNLSLSETIVRRKCEEAGVVVSAIESLPAGGTRLVCMREEGAEEMRTFFAKNIINGKVARYAFQRAQNSLYS
jgi:hypothetical protein